MKLTACALHKLGHVKKGCASSIAAFSVETREIDLPPMSEHAEFRFDEREKTIYDLQRIQKYGAETETQDKYGNSKFREYLGKELVSSGSPRTGRP